MLGASARELSGGHVHLRAGRATRRGWGNQCSENCSGHLRLPTAGERNLSSQTRLLFFLLFFDFYFFPGKGAWWGRQEPGRGGAAASPQSGMSPGRWHPFFPTAPRHRHRSPRGLVRCQRWICWGWSGAQMSLRLTEPSWAGAIRREGLARLRPSHEAWS